MGKILRIFWNFWKNFFEIRENFFKIFTTVYKAGYSKSDDLYNLVTKIVTKYPVLTTYKILQNYEKKSPIFEELATKKFFQNIADVFFIILRIL